MVRHFAVLAVLLCLVVPVPRSEASGLCCQLSSGVRENFSGVAAPETGEISIQTDYSFTLMDRFRQGSEKKSVNEARSYVKPDGTIYTALPITMDMLKYTVTAGYGFNPDIKGFISLPFIRNTMDMTSQGLLGWNDMTMEPTSGTGDVTIMGLYRLYTDQEIRPSHVFTVGIGVKTPTGSSAEKSASGKLVHAHMQPGTGSWDPLISLIYSGMTGRFFLQADGACQNTGRNREGYEVGDSTAVNLAATYAAIKELNIGAGLTFLHLGKASDRNGSYHDPLSNSSLIDDPANTGSDSLWIAPSLQVFPLPNLLMDARIHVPVWEKVNGIQLVSAYRMLIGISYRF